MCDYSLSGMRSRLAVEGEELIVHKFPTQSIGLVSPPDLQPRAATSESGKANLWKRIMNFFGAGDFSEAPAVCVPPGARLMLKNIPDDLQRTWNVGKEETVLFLQTSMEANTYRDAIMFTNGCQIHLQELSEGIPVWVVSLGGDSVQTPEPAISIPSGPPAA
jgi:hypothetical protein